jgi:hypothetical protein
MCVPGSVEAVLGVLGLGLAAGAAFWGVRGLGGSGSFILVPSMAVESFGSVVFIVVLVICTVLVLHVVGRIKDDPAVSSYIVLDMGVPGKNVYAPFLFGLVRGPPGHRLCRWCCS